MTSFLIVVSLLIGIVTNGQAPLVLPEFIQSLPPEKYEAWALWQNNQAQLHKKSDWEPPYLQRDNLDIKRQGPDRSFISYQSYYVNNYYTGPGPLTVLNPYCRFSSYEGAPNWGELYVYNGDEICTLTEALIKVKKSILPEDLYYQLMSPYFK